MKLAATQRRNRNAMTRSPALLFASGPAESFITRRCSVIPDSAARQIRRRLGLLYGSLLTGTVLVMHNGQLNASRCVKPAERPIIITTVFARVCRGGTSSQTAGYERIPPVSVFVFLFSFSHKHVVICLVGRAGG